MTGQGHPSPRAPFPTPGALSHLPPRPRAHQALVCSSVLQCHLGRVGMSSQVHRFFLPIKLDLHLLFASALEDVVGEFLDFVLLNAKAVVLTASGA